MLHCSVCRVLLVALAVVLVAAASPASALGAKKDKQEGRTNSDGVPVTEDGLIDLLRAHPSQVDLAKIDPAKLHLTKKSVRQIDLDKWDLSKLDFDKIKDGKVIKNIIKEMEQAKRDDRTAAAYKPGELERLQQEHLQWLQEPPPFREPTFTRLIVPLVNPVRSTEDTRNRPTRRSVDHVHSPARPSKIASRSPRHLPRQRRSPDHESAFHAYRTARLSIL